MKILPIFILLAVFYLPAAAQKCPANAPLVAPVLSEAARQTYETKLAEARAEFEKNPSSADALIWLGRRTAYLGNYREAIKIFGDGIKKFPKDARLYRHRGHRLITLRCFDAAVKDFAAAVRLTKDKLDEIEPDGLPNARNVPTSSLQTNIFYHLGLAHYLKGDYKKALVAFIQCYNLARSDDMSIAAAHWVYMTSRRMGNKSGADDFIARAVKANPDIIENEDYHKLVRLYLGRLKAGDLMKEISEQADTLSSASLGYGLGNWYLYNGEREKAFDIFRRITDGDQWASFGFIAAEAELKGTGK